MEEYSQQTTCRNSSYLFCNDGYRLSSKESPQPYVNQMELGAIITKTPAKVGTSENFTCVSTGILYDLKL